MKFWEHFTRKYTTKTNAYELARSTAYRSVFYGNADRPQQQSVLADLAARCGWNQITNPKYASDRELWFAEGKRAAYAEIFSHLSLSPADVEAIDNAVRHEAIHLDA